MRQQLLMEEVAELRALLDMVDKALNADMSEGEISPSADNALRVAALRSSRLLTLRGLLKAYPQIERR